ncbi:MAG: MBOAT family O-acyltransferase [Eubacteriales bacterium]
MLFNSVQFLIFFPVTIIIYFLLPHKFRKYFLLAASCYFYMSFIPKYIFILLFTTIVDYSGALAVERLGGAEKPRAKKAAFIIALACNIGLLVFFKYLGMLGDTFNFFGAMINLKTIVVPEIALPIGISFHTFQSMGYLIDVYTGKEKAEHNFINFALFLMYFPQLVAGPIERSRNLFSQLKAEHRLTYDNISAGGRMMLWGMFKKVVVADNLAIISDAVFSNVTGFSGMGLVVGILCFTVQIYCDFSGYSDIAIGCARVMDINLMTNFDTPYFSASTPEFWRRWHISLSTWFRDYIYIPMGGNRVSKPRWVLNQMVTFAVSGIWHGANFTYAVWGLLNGAYIVISRFTKPLREKLKRVTHVGSVPALSQGIGIAVTFCLISFSWIFFRADNFADAFYVISNMFGSYAGDFSKLSELRLHLAYAAPAMLFGIEILMKQPKIVSWYKNTNTFVRIASYALLTAIIIVFGAYDNKAFIYFQF